LTNPIFWIGTVIAGIGYLIYKNWDKLKNFFKGFWVGVKEGFKPVGDLIKNISVALSPVFGFIAKIAAKIGSLLSNQKLMFTIGKLIGKTFTVAFSPLIWGIKAINFIIDLFKGIGNAITKGFSPLDIISEKFKPIFNALLSVKNFAMKMFSFMLESFKTTITSIAKFTEMIFGKSISFVKSGFSKLGELIKSILTTPVKIIGFIIGKVKYLFSLLKNNPISKILSRAVSNKYKCFK